MEQSREARNRDVTTSSTLEVHLTFLKDVWNGCVSAPERGIYAAST